MVYDQDRVLSVSENHGDIIYTEGFQTYADALRFQIYLCRGADPESKGKIEAVVKYLKYNFAKNRCFVDSCHLNEQCMDWLLRTGNGKEHQTTKKIPAQMREILTVAETYEGMEAIEKALELCIRQELYSAVDLRMAVEYFAQTVQPESEQMRKSSVPEKYQSLHPQVRSIQEYIQAAEG